MQKKDVVSSSGRGKELNPFRPARKVSMVNRRAEISSDTEFDFRFHVYNTRDADFKICFHLDQLL